MSSTRIVTLAKERYNTILGESLLPLTKKEADSLLTFFSSIADKQAITVLSKVVVGAPVLRKKYHPDNETDFASPEIRVAKKLREYPKLQFCFYLCFIPLFFDTH